MKLSISNIAWSENEDFQMYEFLKSNNFSGLEIAPTRIIPDNPYDNIEKAKDYSSMLITKYNLEICSMQSIWFGKSEKLFGNQEDRAELLEYTKKAIDFASTIGCKNLVFGSPKNRIIENESQISIAIDFFKELGNYAYDNNTVLSMEANPEIYGTNFINTTSENIALVKTINSPGFMINLDFGTIIQNNENLNKISDNLNLINHIHISEPYLAKIEIRKEHNKLCEILKEKKYNKFISIEMKNLDDLENVKQTVSYIKGVFDVN